MGREGERGWRGEAGGGRRGWRHWFNATGVPGWMRARGEAPGQPLPGMGSFDPTGSKERELRAMKEQVEGFEEALGELKGRIQALEAPTAAATPRTGRGER
jgi:hypothetical protein